MAITNVYIDGFNLYCRALKGTPYKWLDLSLVCQSLLPSHQIGRIRYFTAIVQPRNYDLQAGQRQAAYIKALSTVPNLTVHLGAIRTHRKRLMPATSLAGISGTIEVWNTEEKGTDVNLASYLLLDGFQGDYEQAVVISNDSDFSTVIGMVRDNLGLPIGVVNPSSSTPKVLRDSATFTRRLRINTLANWQFPPHLSYRSVTITKPASW